MNEPVKNTEFTHFQKISHILFLSFIHAPVLEQREHVDLREVEIIYLFFILLKPFQYLKVWLQIDNRL